MITDVELADINNGKFCSIRIVSVSPQAIAAIG
jgi:hypothetical protein